MKDNTGPVRLNIRLLFRLCLPATVFIVICVGIFFDFLFFLSNFAQSYPLLVSVGWPLLFIFYILFGVAFTRFMAQRIRRTFDSEGLSVQRRMAYLSGLPFYVLCLLCIIAGILSGDDVMSGFVYGVFGGVSLGIASFGYLILVRFFLGSSPAIAPPTTM